MSEARGAQEFKAGFLFLLWLQWTQQIAHLTSVHSLFIRIVGRRFTVWATREGIYKVDICFLKDKVDPSVLFLDFFKWSWTCFCILKSLPLYFTLDTTNGEKSAGRLPSCKPIKQNTNN